MIRVLQIIDGSSYGGITKVIGNLSKTCRGVKMDLLTQLPMDNTISLNVSRKSLIGKIKYNHRLYKYLKRNKYDIIHVNSGVFLYSFQVVLISKLAGCKKIVIHSHNNKKVKGIRKILKIILNPLYRKMGNYFLSCSHEAIYSLFTSDKDVEILKNGIYVDLYRYRDNLRKKYRKELGIEDKKVYCNVGRFSKQKNPKFLIELFYNIQKKEEDAILVLVGSGELESEIKADIKKYGIEDKVIILGFRDDVNELLNAFDIFLLPSLYEGLPITVVEALTNGMPTFVSSAASKSANISSNYYKINSFNIDDWMNEISKVKINDRKEAYLDAIKCGYDIKDVANRLEKIYKKIKDS